MDNRIKQYLFDIEQSIEDIELFMGSVNSFSEYEKDKLVKRAVEREIEIIGEAMNRILQIDESIKISNVRQIVRTRNRIIHGYDDVDDVVIYGIVKKHLPILKLEISELWAECQFGTLCVQKNLWEELFAPLRLCVQPARAECQSGNPLRALRLCVKKAWKKYPLRLLFPPPLIRHQQLTHMHLQDIGDLVEHFQGRLHIIGTPAGNGRPVAADLFGQPGGGFFLFHQHDFYAV